MAKDMIEASDEFLKNCWYVAGRCEDFGRNLTAIRLLGEDLVIFRGKDGRPIALEDACPHRKLPLSRGTLEADTVVCGYHGLTFDCSGKCVSAPTQEGSIPKRAVVKSYRGEDRWGFLWIWMGEPERANASEIIDIPNLESPQWARTERGSLSMACHYLYIIDNLLDPSHVAWVHLTSFAGAGTDNRPLDVEDTDDGMIVSRWVMGEPAPPYYASMLPFGDHCDRKQHYECRVPSTAINMSVYTQAGLGGRDKPVPDSAFVNISYNFITPVDHGHSRYFWFQHRNMHAGDAELSKRMYEGAIMAFNEDKDVLEHVHEGMKNRTSPYFNLGLDAGAMRFRRKVERQIAEERSRL